MGTPVVPPARTDAADWRAQRPWLAKLPVCDGLLSWTDYFLPPGASLVEQLKRFQNSGIDHVSVTVGGKGDTAEMAMRTIGRLTASLREAGIAITGSRAAIERARAEGRLTVAFHFQCATPMAGSLDLVDAFFAAGVHRAILAYNEANIFADGCHESRNAGLTGAGRRLVERMDRAGMRIDLTHCGERTTFEVAEMALSRPPLYSHSNARALYDHERNLSDAQIRAAAERDMFIGVNGVGFFLGAEGPEIPREMARHLAHMAGIAGAERLGLGLDFMYLEGSDYAFYHRSRSTWPRGYPSPPWSFLQPEQVGDLVEALGAEGFSRDEIAGILGANYLARVTMP